ncbi:MAG: hypothetical protein RR355_03150 [Oscillospiraceae bacterium]
MQDETKHSENTSESEPVLLDTVGGTQILPTWKDAAQLRSSNVPHNLAY